MYRTFRPYGLLILLAGLLAPLPACDRGDNVTPPIIIQTPEPTRGVIVSASFENFTAGTWFQIPIDIQSQQPGGLRGGDIHTKVPHYLFDRVFA